MARTRKSRLDDSQLRPQRRPHATLGDLIAAAYDVLGPGVRPEEVARVLSQPALARALGLRVRVA